MIMQSGSIKQTKILDKTIGNATGLPPESQKLPLMMAKEMQYTRNCVIRYKEGDEEGKEFFKGNKRKTIKTKKDEMKMSEKMLKAAKLDATDCQKSPLKGKKSRGTLVQKMV